ncbi:MAG: hypothetical protein R2705_16145 [Ilumatobacteraceae bacterium]
MVLGLDDDLVEVACNRRRGRLGRQLQRSRRWSSPVRPREWLQGDRARQGARGARSSPLQVSGALHTPFMAPARDWLRKAIAEANPRDTDVPIVSNVDALPMPSGRNGRACSRPS